MFVSRVGLAGVFALACAFWPQAASAQAPCRFVFGFAELAARVGPAMIGECRGNQRTITGEESFDVADGVRLTLPAGTAVQSTTTGVLTWSPDVNLTQFHDGTGIWTLAGDGVRYVTWDEYLGRTPATTPAQAASSPPPTSEHNSAASTCFRAATDGRISSLYAGPEEQRRAEAEGKAKSYLCNQALTKDGPSGVDCFLVAWEAAQGMEQVFQGSGQRAYDEKYARCMGR
jgi:hypothetical protein